MGSIHHVTAVGKNMKFYRDTLGLNFVKKTVNFDDPYTYHIYFGNEIGSPGTALTFFLWDVPPVIRGTGQISTVMYEASDLDKWEDRLKRYSPKRIKRFDDDILQFTDPNGMEIELVDMDKKELDKFYGVKLKVTAFEKDIFNLLGFKQTAKKDNTYRYEGEDVIDIMVIPNGTTGRLGMGAIHHVALQANDDNDQMEIRKKLLKHGLNVTPQINRKYFRSIYFRLPSGVLFEIATLEPGFLVDEKKEELGSSLKLPEQYEHMREDIKKHLPELDI